MERDAFSQCHPLTNFVYFLGAIGFAVVLQHPAYLAVSCLAAAVYLLLLRGRAGAKVLAGLAPFFVFLSVVNPLFNTYGQHVLFTVFGRPYTWEALCYGMVIAGMFAAMILWFGCYSAVLTSDKFVCLFGGLIPGLSLLLVMVLRLIPNLMRKARQILAARAAIGLGAGQGTRLRDRAAAGMAALSALTDWALEGGIVTADSMRARGYGVGRRTSFQIYRFTVRDAGLLALTIALAGCVVAAGGTQVQFTPVLSIPRPGWGLGAYAGYLFIPPILHGKEALHWRVCVSRI